MVEEGYFRNDRVEGLAIQTLTNGDRYVAEYKEGNLKGALTAYPANGRRYNAIVIANNRQSFYEDVHDNPERAFFYLEPAETGDEREKWLEEHVKKC